VARRERTMARVDLGCRRASKIAVMLDRLMTSVSLIFDAHVMPMFAPLYAT
jgi:hypothetical protein